MKIHENNDARNLSSEAVASWTVLLVMSYVITHDESGSNDIQNEFGNRTAIYRRG